MKQITTYIVDSFTNENFKGNPAGVCILEADLSDTTMLSIAQELGLSETAFIKKLPEISEYSIRYFSPKMEIPLCGHATLASAKILFNNDKNLHKITFNTIENISLKIVREENDFIKMTFPIYSTKPSTAPLALLNALGLTDIENAAFNEETNILILEIASCEILQNLQPDFGALYKSHNTINGVLVTSLSNKENFDFESRYFWPWSGTNEDPVTGGTHTFLAKYWGDKLHKTKMNSFQCSKRSGFMEVALISNDLLTITSTAKIILEGKLNVS